MTPTVGSLFAGIGGFDLGLEWAGMDVRWQVEIDENCRRVLARHWPEVPRYGDIREIDWSDVEPVDVICGGYPCQPFSCAGQRAGEHDARHLWPEVARCIRDLGPRWVLLENVAGHLSLGFGDVLGELASLGYDTWWDCIPAAAVGAPHLRDRVFCVAWRVAADEDRRSVRDVEQRLERRSTVDGQGVARNDGGARAAADSAGQRREGAEPLGADRRSEREVAGNTSRPRAATNADRDGLQRQSTCDRANRGVDVQRGHHAHRRGVDDGWVAARELWGQGPSVSPVRGVDDGVPRRVDKARLRALGNAIVPQVAELIGRGVMMAEAELAAAGRFAA